MLTHKKDIGNKNKQKNKISRIVKDGLAEIDSIQ